MKKKTIIIISIILFCLIVGISYKSYSLYRNHQIEQQRISHIDKNSFEIKSYVDIADDVGGKECQLNWKEIVAIAGIKSNNYINTLKTEDIENIAKSFIDEENKKVYSYEEVISKLNLDEKQIERANIYLDDLSTFGYMPDKYVDDSREMIFINSIKEEAISNYKEFKILPSITIAQAILESGWGETKLATDANNLFGIKADPSWTGEKVSYETKEFNDTYIMDYFRKYENVNQSIKDHAEFLAKNQRYTKAGVFDSKTYKEQANKLQDAGYSTAEDEDGNKIYANMLITIIRQYNLQLIDHEIMEEMQKG